MNEIIKVIESLVHEVMETNVPVTAKTVAADVDGWDSIRHLQLIIAVEKRFGIRLDIGDIVDAENVGMLAESVGRTLAAAKRAV